MKKIYSIRNLSQQQANMWNSFSLDNEIKNCPQWNTLNYFLKYLPKDKPILEAGCGLGIWLIYLRNNGYNVEGIDYDWNVISKLNEMRPDLPARQGDICNLPYKDNSLGAYISLGVLEHFEEGAEKPLSEAKRVLMPGGIAIFTLPFNNFFRRMVAHPLRELYLLVHWALKGNKYFSEYRYSKREAYNMIIEAGFHVIETDINDFINKNRSLALWSEFPFLQSKELYSLNIAGKIAAYLMNSLSINILSAGILIVAQKPYADTKEH